MKHLLAFILANSLLSVAVTAADIVALCIGNNDYTRVEDQLDTPVNDALLMKTTLEALPGSADVKLLTDASREDIQIALNALKVRAKGAKLALVFYSGHGMDGQPDGFSTEDTFLLPVDATIPDVNYLDTRAISLSSVLTALKNTPVTARAVILDCCRSGAPKATSALASSTKNFGDIDERVKAALGKAVVPDATLVAFAASPGRKAAAFLTDADENSPFTKFLTDQLATGSGNLRDLVEAAAETAETRTGKRQVPYVTYTGAASAIRQIVFRATPAMPVVPTPMLRPSQVPSSSPVLGLNPGGATDPFAGTSAGQVWENSLGSTFRWCPPGEFWMGSSPDEMVYFARDGVPTDDETQHKVKLTKGFWLSQFELTQGEWTAVMGTSVHEQARFMLQDDILYEINGEKVTLRDYKGVPRDAEPSNQIYAQGPSQPMYFVNWEEASFYCEKLTTRELASGKLPAGWRYALPTEAQWEYACRAGTETPVYSGELEILGTNNAPALDAIAWYSGNSSQNYVGRGYSTDDWPQKQYVGGNAGAHRVGQKLENAWGLYDMIGNVWEWYADYYQRDISRAAVDPQGSAQGEKRVTRGGTWYKGPAASYRAALRGTAISSRRYDTIGFRPALVPPP